MRLPPPGSPASFWSHARSPPSRGTSPRAIATCEAIVAERVPAAAGSCRVTRLEGFTLDVEADAPIVAQELRLRGTELLAAFAAAPGGVGATDLRVHVRRGSPRL